MSVMRITVQTAVAAVLASALLIVAACEDSTDPILAGGISIVSGDGQYSKVNTQLPQPLVVEVRLSDGSIASGVSVRFQATEGGGNVTPASVKTNSSGTASANLVLGPSEGMNKVRASVADDPSINVDFTATAAAFFCPEQDPTFVQKHFPILAGGGLYLFTRESNLNTQGNTTIAGIISMSTAVVDAPPIGDPAGDTLSVETQSVGRFREDQFSIIVPRDLAFSAAGDLYGVWTADEDEIVKFVDDSTGVHFAQAVGFLGTEIATAPKGIVFGVDEFGVFSVGCRDSLERFEEARFSGMGADAANDDALAVDPLNDDIYFIYLLDNYLYRLPVDSLTATGPIEQVVALTSDEAEGANGMVMDDNGAVYILVDTDNTKAILKVEGATKSVFYDFFDRGPGSAAGVQNELAANENWTLFYTLDTLNNKLLLIREPLPQLLEASPVTTGELSSPSSGERVGLAWIPEP